jgi:hypothetical protein
VTANAVAVAASSAATRIVGATRFKALDITAAGLAKPARP